MWTSVPCRAEEVSRVPYGVGIRCHPVHSGTDYSGSRTVLTHPVVDSGGARASAWLATWAALKPPSELPFMFTWRSWKGWRASHSAEIEPDPEMVVLDALSHKYTNQPFRCASRAVSRCGSPSRRSATRCIPSSTHPPTAEAPGTVAGSVGVRASGCRVVEMGWRRPMRRGGVRALGPELFPRAGRSF